MKKKDKIIFSSSLISKDEFNEMLAKVDPEGKLKKLGFPVVYKKQKKS